MKFCWLLTTYQSHAASAHWRLSLVSDYVPGCRFQLGVSRALVWFHTARGQSEWCILLWCLAAQTVTVRHLSSCWRLFLSSASCVRKSTELQWHKTPDFTPDVASQKTRPQFSGLQITESHLGMLLSETARDVKHRWWAAVINRMIFINRMTYYISQGRAEAPIRIGGQLCYSSDGNLLRYLCAKNYQNTM